MFAGMFTTGIIGNWAAAASKIPYNVTFEILILRSGYIPFRPRLLAMMSFMISVVPAKIDRMRTSR